MAAYKDEERGTWYVSFYYEDWTGAKKRKVKRGFRTNSESRHGYDNGRVCRSLLPRQVSVIEGQEYQEQKRYDECSTVTVF